MVGHERMKSSARKILISTLLIAILAVSALAIQQTYFSQGQNNKKNIPYVGIAYCGTTITEAKELIDKSKDYTNLFVLASGRNPISKNQSAVEEICDFAVANDLSIIINLGIDDIEDIDESAWFWQADSLEPFKQQWTERWGDKFLGIYYNDEPGGIQLDGDWALWFELFGERLNSVGHPAMDSLYQIYLKMLDYVTNGTKPQDYDLEADFFIQNVIVEDPGLAALKKEGYYTFTSDYGLFWFDYLGGYDVLFTEIGWNVSVAQQIALVKGAARLQEKEWGAMITWKYGVPPFLDSGDEIYNQMLTAYQTGAKYIVIFNYATLFDGKSAPAMTEEHYIALERFWNDINQKNFADLSQPQAVLILPRNYGWGMRYPDDNIWGFWPADEKAPVIGEGMSKLLAQYGASLDIVFEDPAFPVSKGGYKTVYRWSETS